MQLYSLALMPSTTIIKSVVGSFTSALGQQLVIAKTKSLELYNISENGKLQAISTQELFCIVRTISSFRYHGSPKDMLIIGSDSGKVIILQFDEAKRRFIKTHEETFGKSGCRRIIPGQYIAVDPRGRAFMIGAIQKQKFVYTLNRENEKLYISSPRQAHKSHTIVVDMVALDVGNQNAIFVCIQMDYGEVEDKQALINQGGIKKVIAYYEMDFGMNTVIRKKQFPIDQTAHMLIAVPDAPDGPGGVIVLLEDYLIYKTFKQQKIVRFPVRKDRPIQRKTQFTAYTMYRQKGQFFFIIASQLGDLFKVEFMLKQEKNKKEIISIKIQYYCTVSCLTSINLSKNGYLFCAGQKEDHMLYSIVERETKLPSIYTHSQQSNNAVVEFTPINIKDSQLQKQDTIEQFGPATDLKVFDLKNEGTPQIYMINASGSGKKNYLRVIKQGLKVKQLHSMKFAKGLDIWTLKGSNEDEYDKIVIISREGKTQYLTLSQNGLSNTKDTGIDEDKSTIHFGRLQDNSLIQVVHNGFRHIQKDKSVKFVKFEGKIIKAATRGGQMIIALAGGDIFYYELDESGNMSQAASETLMDSEVVALDLAPIQKGRVRSNFFVAAFENDQTKIFELGKSDRLQVLSSQQMNCRIESIVLEEMATKQQEDDSYRNQLYLYVGLENGMLIRTSVDIITGKLYDSRPKYLGSKPVKCVKMIVMGRQAILALSSRLWLIYTYGNKQFTTLLSFNYLDIAGSLRLQKCAHSIIGFVQNTLKILSIESFGSTFHSKKIPLQNSAKKMTIFKKKIAIIQSDLTHLTQSQFSMEEDNKDPKRWVSKVKIYLPEKDDNPQENMKEIPMETNQVCLSICAHDGQEEGAINSYLLVGCAKNLRYHPKFSLQESCIKVYNWNDETSTATLLYKTEVQSMPLVIYSWKQRVLTSIGNCLRAYEIGKKKLLRKAEIKNLNSPVNSIHAIGSRIYTTEVGDSFHLYKFKQRQQSFTEIADDILPRYITASAILDYHTVIGADKFENVFISRVPQNAQQDVDNNPNSYKFRWQYGYLNGAPFKMEQVCSFYVGQIITSIQKASLATTGSQIIIYSTINGGIGALCPFEHREDVDFFTHLQLYMRNLTPSLGGREHLMYRSYYSPCKAVVDGDLCEVFMRLPYEQQVTIGKHLDLTPPQINKKLQSMRDKLI